MRTIAPWLLLMAGLVGSAAAQMSPEQAQKLLEQSAKKEPPAASPDPTPSPTVSESAASVVAPTPDQPFNFNALPPAIQQRFQREADNYLCIGHHIWSIELFIRAQRFAQSAAAHREPYMQKDAPLFYQPVGGRRARTLAELLPQTPGARLLHGPVIAVGEHGSLVQIGTTVVYVTDLPADLSVKKGQPLTVAVRSAGTFNYHVNGQPRQGDRYTALPADLVRPVSPAELAQHFAVHQIKRFHRWQSRKIWDRLPKAKVVYDNTSSIGAEQNRRIHPYDYRSGGHIGMGQSTGREVITDPGAYHWQWIDGGVRVPPLVQGFATKPRTTENPSPAASAPAPTPKSTPPAPANRPSPPSDNAQK